MNLLYLYIICRFIFCQQISVFLLFTKSSTLSDHFIFLLRFQFFIGKDQLVHTDIIIFYEIFFAKLGTAYFDYRKHGQFEWAAPAILFACLVFTLTAPLYVWQILGM